MIDGINRRNTRELFQKTAKECSILISSIRV